MKRIIFLMFFLLMLFSIGLSQEVKLGEIRETILSWAAWYWLFFISGIFVIAVGIILRKKGGIAKLAVEIGLLLVFVAIFLAEILYILPHVSFGPKISYKACKSFFGEFKATTPEKAIINVFEIGCCIFTGFVPVEFTVYSIVVFILFMMIIPLAILITLFWDFSSFITHPNARKVIAFCSALLSYRMLISTFFIEFLSYGFGGIGILFFNYLFFGWSIKAIRKLFAFSEHVSTMLSAQDLAELDRLIEMREELLRAYRQAISMGDIDKAEKIRGELEKINTLIENLRKGRKRVPAPSSPPHLGYA